jgi:hypothetical protein
MTTAFFLRGHISTLEENASTAFDSAVISEHRKFFVSSAVMPSSILNSCYETGLRKTFSRFAGWMEQLANLVENDGRRWS